MATVTNNFRNYPSQLITVATVTNNFNKDYDHSDSRYYRPGVFCLSKGLYIEVGCVFNVFFHADLEFEVRFLKFLLLLSRF